MQTHEYSACAKLYNDKITICKYRQPPKNRFRQFSETHKINLDTGELVKYEYSDFKKRIYSDTVSLARARNKVVELSEKNGFMYFLTITFNQKFVDRSNALIVHNTFKNIIKRLKYHYIDIAYVSVPEFHADNENIHYHLMINLAVKPKLKFKKMSKRGYPIYTIVDKFKKYDCFLVVSPLVNNNTKYLIKYLTKAHAFPLFRKFSCTRKLNRSRLIDKRYLVFDEFGYFDTYAWAYDYKVQLRNEKCKVLVFAPEGGEGGALAPPPTTADLSYNNTKDEILCKKWDEVLSVIKQFEKQIDEDYKIVFDRSKTKKNREY